MQLEFQFASPNMRDLVRRIGGRITTRSDGMIVVSGEGWYKLPSRKRFLQGLYDSTGRLIGVLDVNSSPNCHRGCKYIELRYPRPSHYRDKPLVL